MNITTFLSRIKGPIYWGHLPQCTTNPNTWCQTGNCIWYESEYRIILCPPDKSGSLTFRKYYWPTGWVMLEDIPDPVGEDALSKIAYEAPPPPAPTPAPAATPQMSKDTFISKIKGKIALSNIPQSATDTYRWFHEGDASNFIAYGKNGDPLAITICLSWCDCANPPAGVTCIGFGESLYSKDPNKTIDDAFANTALSLLPYSTNVDSVPAGAAIWIDGVDTGKITQVG